MWDLFLLNDSRGSYLMGSVNFTKTINSYQSEIHENIILVRDRSINGPQANSLSVIDIFILGADKRYPYVERTVERYLQINFVIHN